MNPSKLACMGPWDCPSSMSCYLTGEGGEERTCECSLYYGFVGEDCEEMSGSSGLALSMEIVVFLTTLILLKKCIQTLSVMKKKGRLSFAKGNVAVFTVLLVSFVALVRFTASISSMIYFANHKAAFQDYLKDTNMLTMGLQVAATLMIPLVWLELLSAKITRKTSNRKAILVALVFVIALFSLSLAEVIKMKQSPPGPPPPPTGTVAGSEGSTNSTMPPMPLSVTTTFSDMPPPPPNNDGSPPPPPPGGDTSTPPPPGPGGDGGALPEPPFNLFKFVVTLSNVVVPCIYPLAGYLIGRRLGYFGTSSGAVGAAKGELRTRLIRLVVSVTCAYVMNAIGGAFLVEVGERKDFWVADVFLKNVILFGFNVSLIATVSYIWQTTTAADRKRATRSSQVNPKNDISAPTTQTKDSSTPSSK